MKIIITVFIAICFLILPHVNTQHNDTEPTQVIKGMQKAITLEGSGPGPVEGFFVLKVNQADLPKNQDRWYVFAMAEPNPNSKKFFGQPSKIEIKKGNKPDNRTLITECKIVEASDSCFIKNNDFDYSKDNLYISVHCDDQCEFSFVTEIDSSYPLELNEPFRLNFEDTAYSKIFSINTEGSDFYELRLLLRPRGFIKFGEPIILLANYGSEVPSREKHDFQGMHIWDDGQGIFIKKENMKEGKMTILIEGPERNVLNFIAKTIQKSERIDVMSFWPEFDMLNPNEQREFVGEVMEGKSYRFKVSTFSGFLSQPEVYKVQEDNQLVRLNFPNPNEKYGEYEFKITKQFIKEKGLKKILLRVTAQKSTSYLVMFSRDDDNISILHPYISESSLMQPKETQQYLIKVEQLIEFTKEKPISQIEIILGNIYGIINAKFYKCNSQSSLGSDDATNCEYKEENKSNFIEAVSKKIENNGGERRYWFDIDWLQYKQSGDTDRAQIVYKMVVVLNNTSEKEASYEIQYKNKDRIYLLKEGELVRDRVYMNEKRHYKFSISDPDAVEVRIHCTKISGETKFSGAVTDPRLNKDFEKSYPVLGVVSLKLKENTASQEVFMEVEGVENSFYSLTPQVIRKSEKNPNKKNGTGYNELIVREDTSYEFLISGKDSIVLQLHTTSKAINLNLIASSTVSVCMTEVLTSPPFEPNCQIKNNTFLELNQKLLLESGTIGNIGIKNIEDRNVTIRVRFTSDGKSDDKKEEGNDQCQLTQMNEMMFKRIDDKGVDADGDSIHCLKFNVDKKEEIELIVDLNENYQYNVGSIRASLNGKEIIPILSPSKIFKKEEVEAACGNMETLGGSSCYLRVDIEGIVNTRLRILAQYTNDALRLMDGVSHSVHSIMKKPEPKYFYFPIHNIENVTVFLENSLGEYKIYANLARFEYFERNNKSKSVYPNPKEKEFESANPFYYLEQILTISKENITEKCASRENQEWINCVLLITVYLEGSQESLNNGKFLIEVSQKNREIKEGVPLTGFLQEKSVAFYHFKNQVQNGTIFINVNNQNKNCLDIYLKEGSVPASNSDFDKSAKAENIIILSNANEGAFSITVEALKNCPYSISFSTSKNNLQKIKKGTFVDIDLNQDEEKSLVFENEVNETFKVLSAHQTGEVIISINAIKKEEIESVSKQDLTKINDWMWSNKDSVRVNNTGKNYCVNCYYLINVKAVRKTQASLIIPSPDTELPLTTDSLIKDLLIANETSIFRAFTESKAQFELYIQYGKLKITITESDNKTSTFTKEYSASNKPIIETFNLTQNSEYEFLRYSKVTIQAIENSYYSFALISNPDPNKRGSQVKYGIPEYMFLEKDKNKCLEGVMGKVDVFLFSFGKSEKNVVQNLKITLKVLGKDVPFKKEIGANEMVLSTDSSLDSSLPYSLCLTSSEPMSLTIIQSSPVNYLPEKTSVMVQNELNITFGSEGKNIIEINECNSRAITEIFSEFNNIKSTSSEIKQRRRSNNIVEFFHYGAVFVNIRSKKSSVRWLYFNESSGEGQGYDDYQSGFVRVYKNNQTILANAPQLSSESTPKSKLISVNYTFFAAKEENELLNAMNCFDGSFASKSIVFDNSQGSQKLVEVAFDIEKDLINLFGKEEYFLIGMKAKATVKLPGGQFEDYRFYYPYQQVGKEMLSSTPVKPVNPLDPETDSESGEFFSFIGYGLVIILVGVALYMVYMKFIKKCFEKKIRLNEDGGMEMKYSDFSSH